jgi:hypothetical protein
MAREIRLDQIGGYVEQQMEKLLAGCGAGN